MCSSLRWLLAAGVLTAGLALTVATVSASKAPPKGNSGVIDAAKLFSEDAVKKAQERVIQVRTDYGKGLFIETIPAAKSKDDFAKRARENYKDREVRGIYVLISKDPPRALGGG